MSHNDADIEYGFFLDLPAWFRFLHPFLHFDT